MNNAKVDPEKRSRAMTALTLRGVVAGYIAYLAYKIVSAEDTEMSRTLCFVLGAVFLVAAILVGTYSFLRFRSDMKAAVIAEDNTVEIEAADEADTADEE